MNEHTSLNLEKFSKLTVFDQDKKEHTLESFWQKQPAVFVFVRHFG